MDNYLNIHGKTAIITGGATLIGHGIVQQLHEAGVNIVVADIDSEGGAKAVAEITNAQFIETDITDDNAINHCVRTTVDRFGTIDFLINLACSYIDEAEESTRSQWLKALDINLVSAALFTKAVHPYMTAQGGGSIINFGSISSKVAQTGRWLYPASKAATVQLTRSMAMDLAPDNIRVNSVSPGWTWSKIMDDLSESNRTKTDSVAKPFHLLGRVGDPLEIGNIVAFLCSERTSFVTGADWSVDGGYSAMGPEQATPAIPLLSQ